MQNRDNNFILGNPTLWENPTIFSQGEIIFQQGLQIRICLEICAKNTNQIPFKHQQVNIGQNQWKVKFANKLQAAQIQPYNQQPKVMRSNLHMRPMVNSHVQVYIVIKQLGQSSIKQLS